MLTEEGGVPEFERIMIGDIFGGRPSLGATTYVSVYRLLEYSLREVLIAEYDLETSDRIFYKAGEFAGEQFCWQLIDKNCDITRFFLQVQEMMSQLKIGILRIEKADMITMSFTIVVEEDLGCSGLPISDERICSFDAGFIRGLLSEYSGKKFDVKEIDCWCSGASVCRFEVKPSA